MRSLDTALALAQTVLQIVESRIELFGVEYRLEKARLAALMGFVCLAAASFVLAGVAAIVALALTVPEDYQALTMLGVSMLFLVMLAVSVFAAYVLMDQKKTPFTETRQELRKDAECLASALRKKK
ncbi:MAG: phage holin family protein [Puniceicoccales bacterium]